MSFITNFFGRIFHRSGEEGQTEPLVGLTGKPLNPLYCPKPRKDDFDEADKELDEWMKSQGYRKYLTAEKGLPRPKRRFLKRSEKMQIGDTKIMFGISRLKK